MKKLLYEQKCQLFILGSNTVNLKSPTQKRIKLEKHIIIQEKGRSSVLADIPESLPALTRASKLQKRAANHGFDWPSISGVVDKLDEETTELKMALCKLKLLKRKI